MAMQKTKKSPQLFRLPLKASECELVRFTGENETLSPVNQSALNKSDLSTTDPF